MKVFFHTAHKALWHWLSKNPGKEKRDWPGWCFNGGKVSRTIACCFACEYDYDGKCRDCPLEWVGGKTCAQSLYEEYKIAQRYEHFENVKYFAAQIRDLPVKKGVVCK